MIRTDLQGSSLSLAVSYSQIVSESVGAGLALFVYRIPDKSWVASNSGRCASAVHS